MTRLLGIDVGTSGCKAILLSESGSGSGSESRRGSGNWKIVAQASESYPVSMPHPTWSEQDPEDWWNAAKGCMVAVGSNLWAEGSAQLTANCGQLTAIGLTGQMHGAVFLDENGDVIRPAILWNDQRTAQECEDIDRIVGAQRVREITCNPPLTGFQLPKILWLRKHEPENFARVRKVLLPKDYVRYRMTGEFVTDASDASGTGIFDVRKREWSREMMEALDLDPEIFPRVVESVGLSGYLAIGLSGLHAEAMVDRGGVEPPDSGFDSAPVEEDRPRTGGSGTRKIPVFAGAGDQAAGAVGTGAVREGVISVSLGTSGVVFAHFNWAIDPQVVARFYEKEVLLDGPYHSLCDATARWHVMGVTLACGGALVWYAQNIRAASVEDVIAEAETAEPSCKGLIFLPYLCGERSPHNDPNVRAGFVGLTLSHSSKEMSRSVLEGATFALRDCFEEIVSIPMPVLESHWVDAPKEIGLPGNRIEVHHLISKHQTLREQGISVRVTGGGAKSRFWVQMIADVFYCPVETLEADEGPAFGAALIAGVGAGIWPSLEAACDVTIRVRERFEPSNVEYEETYRRYRALYPHLREWFRS